MVRQSPLGPLTARLALGFLLVALSALALMSGLLVVATDRDVTHLARQDQDETAVAVADAAAAAYAAAGGWTGADLDRALALAEEDRGHALILDANGQAVGASPGPALTARLHTLAVVVDGERVGTTRVGFATGGLPSAERHLRDILIATVAAGAGLAALLALGAAIVVSRRITRPIVALTAAARAMESGDRTARVGNVAASGELRDLAAAFDRMAEALGREDELRRALVADVAHELRTPLTVLQGSLEAMTDGVLEATPQQLASLHDDVLRLGRVVEDLETLAAADAARLTLETSDVDLAEVAADATASLAPQFESAALHVEQQLAPTSVRGDPGRLHQVVTNLLTNALKFTPAGGQVTVAVRRNGDAAELAVTDSGIGMAPEELPHVFDRFWRSAGAGATAGSGIGLTVVAELVRAHGGTVALDSELGTGTRIAVRLPAVA
ncbi:MAG: ATP-binding protein [Actinomycetota bacterium]|nr:ATP-binding protein [Actinomycetota bacterium]